MFRICQIRTKWRLQGAKKKEFTRLVPHMSSFSYLCRGKSCEYVERVSPERHQAYAGSKDKVFGNLTASPNTERSAISGFDTEQHAPLAPPKQLRGFRRDPAERPLVLFCVFPRHLSYRIESSRSYLGLAGLDPDRQTAGTPLRSEPHDLTWSCSPAVFVSLPVLREAEARSSKNGRRSSP